MKTTQLNSFYTFRTVQVGSSLVDTITMIRGDHVGVLLNNWNAASDARRNLMLEEVILIHSAADSIRSDPCSMSLYFRSIVKINLEHLWM